MHLMWLTKLQVELSLPSLQGLSVQWNLVTDDDDVTDDYPLHIGCFALVNNDKKYYDQL